jgi:uncharacterized protein (DUF1330 family)
MSCYFVAQIDIHDPQEYKLYEDGFDQIFSNYDGQVVVVDDQPSVLEGSWSRTRIVIIRFRTEDEARRWYGSDEYRKLIHYRYRASKADIILAKGRD